MDYYKGIRSLILDGGIYRNLRLSRENFNLRLKSPLVSDLDWIFEFSPKDSFLRECAFISICVYSINGRHLKGDDREKTALFLYKKVQNVVVSRLAMVCISLLDEAKQGHKFLEAFLYETESRIIWRTWKANSNLGFKPIDQGVLNDTQVAWVSWNEAEDQKISSRTQWDQAILIASSMNPKGAQEIKKSWDRDEELDQEYRERVRALARQGIVETAEERERLRKSKDSYDDLKEEMRRWAAGEEDEHDRIVREYKEFMYQKIEDENKRLEDMHLQAEQYRQGMTDLNEIRNNQSLTSTPIVAYTDEQIKEISGVRLYKETNDHQEKFEHFKERYILAKETSGNLKVEDGQIVVVAPQEESLMDRLSKRVPKLD
jgi:hypothetical protein